MNIGFVACIILVPIFGVMGLIFAVFKGKSAKLVSGFNTLSKDEQKLYDKEYLASDMKNQCFAWTGVMIAGALASLICQYFAITAYIIWIILFFKDVHLDAHKAFEKYLIK